MWSAIIKDKVMELDKKPEKPEEVIKAEVKDTKRFSLDQLKIHGEIGKGSFGVVKLITDMKSNQ